VSSNSQQMRETDQAHEGPRVFNVMQRPLESDPNKKLDWP